MTTLLTYIKEGKYDSCLFKSERLNEDKNMLNIKTFNDNSWFILNVHRLHIKR